MLQELRVENLLLIEQAQLRLAPGLNVLTGETGAGKTVLAHALDLLLGGRARPGIVRPGAGEAYVEGIFDLPDALREQLGERISADAQELMLARRVGADGRTRAYLDGRAAAVAELRDLGGALLAFYGQHEHRKLTLSAAQLRDPRRPLRRRASARVCARARTPSRGCASSRGASEPCASSPPSASASSTCSSSSSARSTRSPRTSASTSSCCSRASDCAGWTRCCAAAGAGAEALAATAARRPGAAQLVAAAAGAARRARGRRCRARRARRAACAASSIESHDLAGELRDYCERADPGARFSQEGERAGSAGL